MPDVAVLRTSHKWFEDLVALLMGTSLVAFGVLFLKQTGMITGGTAGLSLFLHYKLEYQFGTIFFLINLPFYYLAIRHYIGHHPPIRKYQCHAFYLSNSDHQRRNRLATILVHDLLACLHSILLCKWLLLRNNSCQPHELCHQPISLRRHHRLPG